MLQREDRSTTSRCTGVSAVTVNALTSQGTKWPWGNKWPQVSDSDILGSLLTEVLKPLQSVGFQMIKLYRNLKLLEVKRSQGQTWPSHIQQMSQRGIIVIHLRSVKSGKITHPPTKSVKKVSQEKTNTQKIFIHKQCQLQLHETSFWICLSKIIKTPKVGRGIRTLGLLDGTRILDGTSSRWNSACNPHLDPYPILRN